MIHNDYPSAVSLIQQSQPESADVITLYININIRNYNFLS